LNDAQFVNEFAGLVKVGLLSGVVWSATYGFASGVEGVVLFSYSGVYCVCVVIEVRNMIFTKLGLQVEHGV